MLKIKDNVDLKELENFEFKNNGFCYYKARSYYHFDFMKINIKIDTLEITFYNTNGNKINRLHSKNHKWIIDIIKQLVQAGFVEKVVEI